MCGIAGELRYHHSPTQADWGKITEMMFRRGPDDAGLWSDDACCTMAFRRLAILDLSPTGHQPMVSQDGRYVLVFNGEIYNFAELRQKLTAKGVTFRSTGDSEVVLYALIEWGQEALNKFNGIFALGFYDIMERRLLLARDHAGIKPLYYMKRPEGVVFASQYDQLLCHPWCRDLSASNEALGLYLRLAYIPAPYALLQDTHMLEAGSWLEVSSDGRTRQGQYYHFPDYQTPTLIGAEALDAVDAAITAAVRRQMVSDVPLGAFLSGGIDSPLVVAKMLEADPGSVRAFTIGTAGDVTDESDDAMRYAKELGVEHTLEHVTADQALHMLDDVMAACSEPFGDYSLFPTMLVSRLASRDYKVMLSGDGGDELFWGYAHRAGSLLMTAEDFKQPHWYRKARWGVKKLTGIGNGNYFLRKHRSLGEWQRDKHTHLEESWLGRVFPGLPRWPLAYSVFDYSGWETDRTAQWLRQNEFTSHLQMVLQKVDRASMYHSLEVRVPLLDREVIDIATRVDWQSCLDLETKKGKLPLRASLSRHIYHQTQAKRGFTVPMGEWLRTSLRDVFEEKLMGRQEMLGLEINQQALGDLFGRHLKGPHDYAWGLWPLLSLALWVDRYHK